MKRSGSFIIGLLAFCNSTLAQQAGSLDPTFNPGSGADSTVYSAALCTNGQIVISGGFASVNGQPRNYVARLDADGSLDGGFLPGQGPVGLGGSCNVFAVEVDPSSRVYIGGTFYSFNSIPRGYAARLNNDGGLDLDWDIAFDNYVWFIKRQTDGGFLVGGGFSQANGVGRKNIARLKSDGSFDNLFNPGANVTDGTIYAAAIQPDGKVIIGGSFTTNSPVSRQAIARVYPDGTLDPTFNAGYMGGIGGPGNPGIQAVALQPDGKVVIAGMFSSVNGYSRLGVARLNTNGVVDTTFIPTCDVRGLIGCCGNDGVSLLPDGRILLNGYDGTVNGQPTAGLVMLSASGTCDGTFSPVAVFGGAVWAVALQPDGKIVIGGTFSSVAGTNINRIARLNGTSTNSPDFRLLGINLYAGMLLSGTVGRTYRIDWTANLNATSLWTPLSNVTLQVSPQFVLDPSPTTGRRFYRAVALP